MTPKPPDVTAVGLVRRSAVLTTLSGAAYFCLTEYTTCANPSTPQKPCRKPTAPR